MCPSRFSVLSRSLQLRRIHLQSSLFSRSMMPGPGSELSSVPPAFVLCQVFPRITSYLMYNHSQLISSSWHDANQCDLLKLQRRQRPIDRPAADSLILRIEKCPNVGTWQRDFKTRRVAIAVGDTISHHLCIVSVFSVRRCCRGPSTLCTLGIAIR